MASAGVAPDQFMEKFLNKGKPELGPPNHVGTSQRRGVVLQKGALSPARAAKGVEEKSKDLKLNLGAKEGKDMLNLSSDSDSDQDYEEVNEIVQSFINKQQKKGNNPDKKGGNPVRKKYGAEDLLSDSSDSISSEGCSSDDSNDKDDQINQLLWSIKQKDGDG